MINILFRVLTISLLNTLVYSSFPFLSSRKEENHFCLNRNELNLCFPKEYSSSLCSKGAALPREHYLQCILSSTICDAPGKFSIPQAPSAYYTCKFNRNSGTFEKHVESCSGGKFFDPLTLTCLNAEELSISRSVSHEPRVRPPSCDKAGLIPDRHHCKVFYFCPELRSAPLKLYCSPNKYYNENLKTCTNQMTKSCLSKLLEWEEFVGDRARKNYAAVQATKKLGLFGSGPTSPGATNRHVQDRTIEPEDTQFEDEQYYHQLTKNDPFTKLKHKFPEDHKVTEQPTGVIRSLLARVKGLLSLPWRLRRSYLEKRCRKLNEYSPNFNHENFENLGPHEEPMNHNAGTQHHRSILPLHEYLFSRFLHGQKKTEAHPLQDDWTKEQENPEDPEIRKHFNGKGPRKPIHTLLDQSQGEHKVPEHDPLENDLTEEHDDSEETEFGRHFKRKGHKKPIKTVKDFWDEDEEEWEDDLTEEEDNAEETTFGKHFKGKGHKKPNKKYNHLSDFEDDDDDDEEEEDEEEEEEDYDDEEEGEEGEHDQSEEEGDTESVEFRIPLNPYHVNPLNPLNSLNEKKNEKKMNTFNSVFDDVTKREHDPLQEDLRQEQFNRVLFHEENPVIAEKEKKEKKETKEAESSESSKGKPRRKPSIRSPGKGSTGKPKRKNYHPHDDERTRSTRKEQENSEEHFWHWSGKPLSKKGSKKPTSNSALREQKKRKHNSKHSHLTEGQEDPEEPEFGIHFKGKELREKIKGFLNSIPEKEKIREHLVLPQQENPEGNKSQRRFKEKGPKKPTKKYNHFPDAEEEEAEDDVTKEQENHEETKFGKHPKEKQHKKPNKKFNHFSDFEDDDDEEEEDDNIEETKFGKHPKEKRHKKPNKKYNHFSDFEDDDDEEEEDDNIEETKFGKHPKEKRHKKPNKKYNHFSDFEDDDDEEEEDDNIEEPVFGKHFKGKGHKKPIKKYNHFPDEEEEEEGEDDLTKEQEIHEETKSKNRFKNKKPIKKYNHFPDEEDEEEDEWGDDLTEEEDDLEETKFGKHFKGKGHKKPVKTHNRFWDDEEEEDGEEEEEEEDDLTEEEDDPEETTFGKHSKGKGHKKPIKTLDEEDEEPEDEEEEEEDPEEAEGRGRPTKRFPGHISSRRPKSGNRRVEEEPREEGEDREGESELENSLKGRELEAENRFSDERNAAELPPEPQEETFGGEGFEEG